MASSSIQNVSHWPYDAFLSFRGADTRKSFISHLYAALNGKGIYVFKDDKELERGASISPGLLKAIEDSRILIIVFSQNYASSTWCLDELVKIVQCKNKNDHQQMVFPIFYDVEPTVVRKQTGSFREAFSKHEEAFRENLEKVKNWRDALKEVANISGWELNEYRSESEFIWDIVKAISSKIRVKSETLKNLVGIDSRLEELRSLMNKGPNDDVRKIGICGMGGLGKTTLARVVYDLISHEFEGSSFLADVREKFENKGSVISFQRQLLFEILKLEKDSIWNVGDGINILGSRLQHKKVLLVIDDVVDIKQLEYLAGKREWFGSGSRIIVTSRDEHLLKTHGMDEIYKPNELNYHDALQLFNMKAFKIQKPLEECVQLSEGVLRYVGGLPLALEVLGSFLNGRSMDQWRSTLERLQIEPPNKIMSILQISFDGLQELEKKIFLDIACFFKRKTKDYVSKILDSCGFDIGISVLIEKSLLTVRENNRLWMHDLIQEMGRQIVRKQSPDEPGKRSRLWKEADVHHVLSQNTGSEVVEGIMVDDDFFRGNDVHLSAKAFSLMTNLRLLKISNVQLPEGLEYLSNRNESEFIEEIVNVISSKIRSEPEILKELVGMESRLEKLRFLMATGSNDVRMIGIWGMGGLGKTTLARVVYDLMSHEFDGSSFLADVREKFEKEGSEISLQKQLLSDLLKLSDYSIQNVYDGINIIGSRLQRKKVLLIIDDVADVEQLQRLVGRRDWFGPGSKILITTRDRQLLVAHEVDEEHILDLDVLNNDEALQLFSMKAFKSHQPMGEYVELSKRVLEYAGGLPLALKVLGSFLIGRSADLWRSALERLKKDPSNKIMSILQISFEGLQDSEKKIFLDVACFFKWKNRDYVTKILEGCGFSPVIGIEVLIEKSLLTVDGRSILHMHDLLQELGQRIVTRQSPEEPGKHSRIWKEEEVRQVLTNNTGSEVVEGIMVDDDFFRGNDVHLGAKAFSLMTNLRLLKINNVQLPEGLEYLSNRLRLLDWHRYPLKSLPSNLQLDKTVKFKMCYSRIEELWKGIKPLNMLRVLKLSHSENLIKTPDFTKVPNLEVLDLEGCTRLREIHPSLLRHNKLILLNLKGCTNLTTLPGEIFMKSLQTLVLSGCLKLRKFPDIVGGMECLRELRLDGTDIKKLPLSIELLSKLVLLDLKDCRNLATLPITVSSLKCLRTLKLSGCSKIVKFPETVISVEDLLELFLDGTSITEVPSSIALLTKLQWLNLNDCRSLVRLPSSINSLKSLKTLNLSGCFKLENVPETLGQVESLEKLDISGTAIRQPPSSIFFMKNLKQLSFCGCKGSSSSTSWFLGFPMNLMRRSSDPVALSLPSSLSSLCSLTKLDISYCDLGEGAIPSSIGDLCSLKELYLSGNNFFTLPASINRLSSLWKIELEECKMLQNLPRLPASINLILLGGCVSLETLSDVLNLNEHKVSFLTLHCADCLKLAGNYDLALSLLKEYIKNSENMSLSDKYIKHDPTRGFCIVVPGSEIPGWFEYQNNEGSSITISTPPKTYKNTKLVGYAMCCVFHVPKYSLPYYIRPVPHPVHELSMKSQPDILGLSGIYFRKQFCQAMSDNLFLCYKNSERISKVEFDSPSGLELKRCGLHPIYVHEGDKFNQTSDPVWNLNEFGHDCLGSTSFMSSLNDDLDRAEASGSCSGDDAGSTKSSERSFLKRSLEGYVGAAEASGSGCCNDEEEPQPKRFRQLE